MLNAEIYRRMRESNAEAVGAASALFALVIVCGFLFFALNKSEIDKEKVQTQAASGYGVTDERGVSASLIRRSMCVRTFNRRNFFSTGCIPTGWGLKAK